MHPDPPGDAESGDGVFTDVTCAEDGVVVAVVVVDRERDVEVVDVVADEDTAEDDEEEYSEDSDDSSDDSSEDSEDVVVVVSVLDDGDFFCGLSRIGGDLSCDFVFSIAGFVGFVVKLSLFLRLMVVCDGC